MNKKTKKLAFNISVIIVLLLALGWVCSRFIHWGNVEFTDNAQVRQHIVPVNCRVQGFIRKIYFTEYQTVHKGDTLALIEDAEFRFRLAQAEADYQNALSGKTVMTSSIHTIQNNISVSDASIQEAKIRMDNAGREYKRYQNLLERDAVTRQQYDAVKTNFEASKARYELLLRQKKSTSTRQAGADGTPATDRSRHKTGRSSSGNSQVKPFVYSDYGSLRRNYRTKRDPGRCIGTARTNIGQSGRRKR